MNKRNFSNSITQIFFALIIFFLLYLSFWQYNRYHEKLALINKVKNNIQQQAKNIKNDIKKVTKFDKIELTGEFTDEKIFLYGRRSGNNEKDGYYILGILKLKDSNTRVMVSRGWVPHSTKKLIENRELLLPSISQTIKVVAMPGEKSSYLAPKNDLDRNIWFYIDLCQAKDIGKIDFNKYYFMQIESSNLPTEVKKLKAENLLFIRNDHLEYSITWFTLAVCVLIFGLVKRLSKLKGVST